MKNDKTGFTVVYQGKPIVSDEHIKEVAEIFGAASESKYFFPHNGCVTHLKIKQVNLKYSDIVKILRVLPVKGNEKLIANLTNRMNS